VARRRAEDRPPIGDQTIMRNTRLVAWVRRDYHLPSVTGTQALQERQVETCSRRRYRMTVLALAYMQISLPGFVAPGRSGLSTSTTPSAAFRSPPVPAGLMKGGSSVEGVKAHYVTRPCRRTDHRPGRVRISTRDTMTSAPEGPDLRWPSWPEPVPRSTRAPVMVHGRRTIVFGRLREGEKRTGSVQTMIT